MLSELRVTNLGIVEDLVVLLGPGMTAVTGETGAGKTLLVEALSLLVGDRADATMVRTGADEARVEGRFVVGDDETVVARVVPAVGRSRAYVDGRLATAGELAAVAGALVDLHGQHSHQSLLAPVEQRRTLDHFAGAPAARARRRIAEARADVARIEATRAGLGGDPRARAREIDLLRYEISEIDAAGITDPDEDLELAHREELLADAAAVQEALDAAFLALDGAATDAVGVAVGALAGRDALAALAARLHSLQAELAESASDIRHAREAVVDDPEALEATRSRRQSLRELGRKYGDSLAAVVEFGVTARRRLAELELHDERAAALDGELAAAQAELVAAGQALTALRRVAAAPFADAVTLRLRELALPKAAVTVRVVPLAEVGEDGADDVTFLLAANPGEEPRALARAASGGELSRTMLAIRVVLSEAPPTLVFDEVDAGIGGEAGAAVGRALAGLGAHHQVLCVTHLAQVAAHAHAQIVVRKEEHAGRTRTAVEMADEGTRIAELSRMLAGVGESAHARRHAAELLAGARTHEGVPR